jgi:hypothetical protein
MMMETFRMRSALVGEEREKGVLWFVPPWWTKQLSRNDGIRDKSSGFLLDHDGSFKTDSIVIRQAVVGEAIAGCYGARKVMRLLWLAQSILKEWLNVFYFKNILK